MIEFTLEIKDFKINLHEVTSKQAFQGIVEYLEKVWNSFRGQVTMPKFTRKDDQFLIWEYRGLRVVLDRKRVVPDDPGQDTPALVHYKCAKYRACSTYWCACGEGELLIESRSGGVHKLTENQLEWLDSLDPELTEFLYKTNPVCLV